MPVGLVLLVLMTRVVPDRPGQPGSGIDIFGALLATATAASAIYGLINAGDHGWSVPMTLGPLAAAFALGIVCVVYERAITRPLLDPALLVRRPIAAGPC
ncbi:hypothetical protein [Nocardia xishanensis]|uniref:MFS transporter n=1 Tax=Nocardia xishanensis TaxID=238964 RepID=A0ABW7X7G9_9NOCA